jgi:CO dehydrogenase maturation factor
LKNLVQHLILRRDEVVVLDMEAGIEHLGRGTSKAVNFLLVVVEPGQRSIETAMRIKDLAHDIGLSHIALVGNKIRGDKDRDFLLRRLPEFRFLGFIPYDDQIIEGDLSGTFPENMAAQTRLALEEIVRNLADGS